MNGRGFPHPASVPFPRQVFPTALAEATVSKCFAHRAFVKSATALVSSLFSHASLVGRNGNP